MVDNIINHQSIELHRFKLLPVRSVPSYPYGTDGETEVPRCLLSVIAHRNWSSYCSDCLSRGLRAEEPGLPSVTHCKSGEA